MKKLLLSLICFVLFIGPFLGSAGVVNAAEDPNVIESDFSVNIDGDVLQFTTVDEGDVREVTVVDELEEKHVVVYDKSENILTVDGVQAASEEVEYFQAVANNTEAGGEENGLIEQMPNAMTATDDDPEFAYAAPTCCGGGAFTLIGHSYGSFNVTSANKAIIGATIAALFVGFPPVALFAVAVTGISLAFTSSNDKIVYYKTLKYKGPHPHWGFITTTWRHIFLFDNSNYTGLYGSYAFY